MSKKNVKKVEKKKITNLSFTKKIEMLLKNEAPILCQNTSEVLAIVGRNSCIKEVLDITGQKDVIEQLDLLEDIVILSDELHDLHLEQYVGDLEKLDAPTPDEYTLEEIQRLVDYFKKILSSREAKGKILSYELRGLTELALGLEAYERSINGTLNNSLYKILVNYGTPLVKAKLIDACGFETQEVKDVKFDVDLDNLMFTDNNTGKVYTVPVEKAGHFGVKGYISKVIKAIGKWNTASLKANSTGDSYDEERNAALLEGCDMLKAFTLMDCYLDNHGKIAPASSMFDVESKITKYERQQAKKAKQKSLQKTKNQLQ